jgi:hypothetical protein
MRRSIAILLALGAAIGAARAQDPDSARAILPGCRAYLQGGQANQAGQGICLGRIAVVFSNAELVGACPPTDLAVQQATRAIVEYLDTIPGRWDEGFGRVALEALARSWPCRGAPPPAPR